MLEAERGHCLSYLQQQQAAIDAAVSRVQQRIAALQSGADVPPCSSFASRQPTTQVERWQEVMYCNGLALLLTERLRRTTAQLVEAQHAFAGGASSTSSTDLYDCEDEEGMAM